MNCVIKIARAAGRNFIKPEDVNLALRDFPAEIVRIAVLEVMGRQTDFRIVDFSLCAYVAWQGVYEETPRWILFNSHQRAMYTHRPIRAILNAMPIKEMERLREGRWDSQ